MVSDRPAAPAATIDVVSGDLQLRSAAAAASRLADAGDPSMTSLAEVFVRIQRGGAPRRIDLEPRSWEVIVIPVGSR